MNFGNMGQQLMGLLQPVGIDRDEIMSRLAQMQIQFPTKLGGGAYDPNALRNSVVGVRAMGPSSPYAQGRGYPYR